MQWHPGGWLPGWPLCFLVSGQEILATDSALREYRAERRALDRWMIRHSERGPRSIAILPNHSDMFPLAHDRKAERLERFHHPSLRRVLREGFHLDNRFREVRLQDGRLLN